MAKASKITGYTIEQILNMDAYDLTHMDEKRLRAIVKQLANAGNKRLRAFEKANDKSPAYYGVSKWGKSFGVKGKDYAGLQKEVKRELRFLKSKTSTLSGWRQTKNETIKEIEKFGISLTEEQWRDFWEAYDKLAELSPDVKMETIKYTVFREIRAEMNDVTKSADDIATELKTKVTDLYEKQKRLEKQRKTGGVSRYFK